MPEPRDMSDDELRRCYADSSRVAHDTSVRALLREIERRSLPAPLARKYEPWTGRDDAELLRLIEEGCLVPAIAAQLGRTMEATRTRLARLKRRGLV